MNFKLIVSLFFVSYFGKILSVEIQTPKENEEKLLKNFREVAEALVRTRKDGKFDLNTIKNEFKLTFVEKVYLSVFFKIDPKAETPYLVKSIEEIFVKAFLLENCEKDKNKNEADSKNPEKKIEKNDLYLEKCKNYFENGPMIKLKTLLLEQAEKTQEGKDNFDVNAIKENINLLNELKEAQKIAEKYDQEEKLNQEYRDKIIKYFLIILVGFVVVFCYAYYFLVFNKEDEKDHND